MDTHTAIIDSNFQQAYASNCCGAYSLTAILDAFGIFKVSCLDKDLDSGQTVPLQYNGRNANIGKGSFLKGIGNELYKITGDPDFNCQNLPDSLVYIASRFLDKSKYDISINITEESYKEIIQFFPAYKSLVEKCAEIIGKANVNTAANIFDYKIPSGLWCQHLVVRISSEYDYGDLHWIARDGQGLIYDPICGTSGNDWSKLTLVDPATGRLSTIQADAGIIMSDTIHCHMPLQEIKMDYTWIGFWIDYKLRTA